MSNLDITAQDFSYCLDADALFLIEPREKGHVFTASICDYTSNGFRRTVWRIHFRKLSTCEVHPLTAQPYIDFLKTECDVWESCEMLSHEDILTVEFSDQLGNNGMKRLAAVMLNWRTGQEILVRRFLLHVYM